MSTQSRDQLDQEQISAPHRLFCKFPVSIADRLYLNACWYERESLATFRAFAIVTLNYLVRGLQIYPFVENGTTFLTNYPLRHTFTAVAKRGYNRCRLFIDSDLCRHNGHVRDSREETRFSHHSSGLICVMIYLRVVNDL